MGKNINGQYVPSGALLLYEKYKLLSRKNSFAWCGNMYLAAETGLKPETCSKYTKILADAGMIARDFVWDDEEHTVLQRRVFVVDKKIYMQPEVKPEITLADVYAQGELQKQEAELNEEKKAQRRRLYKYADLFGVHRVSLAKAINHWGADYVEEKFAIVNASHPRYPAMMFFKACWAGYKPNKRAQKQIGKEPKQRRVVVVPDIREKQEKKAPLETLKVIEANHYSLSASHLDDLKKKCIEEIKQMELSDIERASKINNVIKRIEILKNPQQEQAEKEPEVNISLLQRDILATGDPARRAALIGQLPKERQKAMWQLCIKLEKERAAAS